jgi:hypothetical protein
VTSLWTFPIGSSATFSFFAAQRKHRMPLMLGRLPSLRRYAGTQTIVGYSPARRPRVGG